MKPIIDRDQCTGCGNCLAFCPQKLLHLSETCNARGVPFVEINDPSLCRSCRRCSLMCTAGAVVFADECGSRKPLIDKKAIPPHAGCYLGSLTKALSDVLRQMEIVDQIVIFKKKTADVNLKCEIHDYPDESFYDEALAYKETHPEKLVVLICSSSKAHSTALNRRRFWKLRQESVTIINTLNWFETDAASGRVIAGGAHLPEEIGILRHASLTARCRVRSAEQLMRLEACLHKAIALQQRNKSFSLIEIVFPCFYRLTGRPQTWMSANQIAAVNRWFSERVEPDYPEGIFWDQQRNEK